MLISSKARFPVYTYDAFLSVKTLNRHHAIDMNSPFPKSSSSPGDGRVVVRPLPSGGSGLEAISYQYPLKLISPSSGNRNSVLVFLLSYGGGLVGGDSINLSIDIRPQARLSLVTQGHTKVFKSATPDIVTRQSMTVRIEDNGALCLLPDPVQPFEDSVYAQTQIFHMEATSSLCLLDWVTQGRTARGEDWSFRKWTGRNEVWLTGTRDKLLVRDAMILSAEDSLALGRPLRDTMRGMSVMGTLILRGPLMKKLGDFFLSEFAALPRIGGRDFRTVEAQEEDESKLSDFERWRARRIAEERRAGVLWSAAQVRGCVIVKFGGATVEAGREWIGSMLVKEESIEQHFGYQALMCV